MSSNDGGTEAFRGLRAAERIQGEQDGVSWNEDYQEASEAMAA